MRNSRILVTLITLCISDLLASDIDQIPPKEEWTYHGIAIPRGGSAEWDGGTGAMIAGLSKKGETYYMYYLRGFRGCWEADRKGSHTAVGLATSIDGENWTRYEANPVMVPQDFIKVTAHEEGIRHGATRFVEDLNRFI